MSLRAARRGLVLVLSLLFCFFRYQAVRLLAALQGKPVTVQQKADWMHFCGRITLPAMGIHYRVEGNRPTGPTLIVANHLSYLDIAILSAALPCSFVAKREIGDWPGFGPLSRMGGTIFVDRSSRTSAWVTAQAIRERLALGVPVLFFPEGTSTDGSEVQRFHSTLFEPAVESGLTVTPAAVFYEAHGSATERDLCWFGDDPFLPHLVQVLEVEGFAAVVRFGPPETFPDRKAAAWRSHDTISGMRNL